MWWNKLTQRKGQILFNNIVKHYKLYDVVHNFITSDSKGNAVDSNTFVYPYHNLHNILFNLSDKQFDEMMEITPEIKSVCLGMSKEKQQLGLFNSIEQAFDYPDVDIVEVWNLDENTGQYFSNMKVGKPSIIQKSDKNETLS